MNPAGQPTRLHQHATKSAPSSNLGDVAKKTALLQLGRRLRAEGYWFTTVTPLTHQRVNERSENSQARSLRDIFGWSRPFKAQLLYQTEFQLLLNSGVLSEEGDLWTSKVRWSSINDLLFVHSRYPTVEHDAVFFGPDTYRFTQAIEEYLRTCIRPISKAIDIGCGSGAGAILIAQARPEAEVLAVDINPEALSFTTINAELAEVGNITTWHSDLLIATTGEFDLIVANPPYMQDQALRAYRNGGDNLGTQLSLSIVEQALLRLSPGGSLLLYTGAPSINGRDIFLEQAHPLIDRAGFIWSYREMDPDVFGEELETANYANAERIAAVVLTVTRID